ncbi:hypothetical protein FRC19_007816 [Serendipita sp. 401]|nr:hypothetical protein FRC19_007816 [Serendipita sp. 401]KAG9021190.1 hypothetical protein FS842_006769 [Serendipita sp. 407]
MSPVFKDMETLGAMRQEGNNREISLSEDELTWSTILRFIDPKKKNPPLDYKSLPKLLEAGRKYQIDEVRNWVNWWLLENESAVDSEVSSLDTPQAIELLAMGVDYDVPRYSQLALRFLIKAPIEGLFNATLARSKLYQHLMELRTERIKHLHQELKTILSGGASNQKITNGEFSIKDKDYMDISRAMVQVISAISFQPSYACCMRNWPDILNGDYIYLSRDKMEKFKQNCQRLEAEFPALPSTVIGSRAGEVLEPQ